MGLSMRAARAAFAAAMLWLGVDASAGGAAAMNSHRADHTATLLNDGTVLVVGGYANDALHSAERYDPSRNAWRRLAGTRSYHFGHTATLLRTGKVLFVGNFDQPGFAGAADVFDPQTGDWTSVSPPNAVRTQHAATLLDDGRVLVSGGFTGQAFTTSCEIYDPATGSWTPVSPMNVARSTHTASLLADGRVLVTGGNVPEPTASAEVYDPRLDRWTVLAPMANSRVRHSATVVADGRVVVAGGIDARLGDIAFVEIFDPQSSAFHQVAPMKYPREVHAASLLPDGRVIVAGGGSSGASQRSIEVYDPAANAWSEAGTLADERGAHTMSLLANGQLLVAGGAAIANSETIEVDLGLAVARIPGPDLEGHAATTLPSGEILVTGGYSPGSILSNAQIFTPATGAWRSVAKMPVPRTGHAATLLVDGRVLVVGGTDFGATPVTRAVVYDPVADKWSDAGDNLAARQDHTATLLGNGMVLVVGGNSNTGEIYHPGTNSWYWGGSTSARHFASATLLRDGRVLVAGGYSSGWSADLYDPLTNTWVSAAPLTFPRYAHSATLLESGMVLVAGGFGASGTAEIYDPQLDVWTRVGNLTYDRGNLRAAVLPSGDVIVAGGGAFIERYDVAAAGWRGAGALSQSRARPTVSVLPDGRVLIAGSASDPTMATSADIVETAQSRAAKRPIAASSQTIIAQPIALDVVGSGFNGSSSGGGAANATASNMPIVRLTRLDNDDVTYLAPGAAWNGTTFRSTALNNLTPGLHRLAVTVGGLTSATTLVDVVKIADAAPNQVQWSFGGYAVTEGGAPAILTVLRTGDCSAPASARIALLDGSAKVATDVFPMPVPVVSWQGGDCFPKLVNVYVVYNDIPQGTRQFTVRLVDPVGTTVGALASAEVAILDDDSAPTTMPANGTIVANPFGPMTVDGTLINGSAIGALGRNATLKLGDIPGDGIAYAQIDFSTLDIGLANTLTILSGAANQVVVLNNTGPRASQIDGTICTGGSGSNRGPVVHLHNARGVQVSSTGRLFADELIVDGLANNWNSGQSVVNDGILFGGISLEIMGANINGSGMFMSDRVSLRTFGNANNPLYGNRYLSNGLMLKPVYGSATLALTLNDYGSAPQVFNVMVQGNVSLDLYDAHPAGVPPNNLPVPASAGAGPPSYGGGSLIVQASGTMTLDGAKGNVVFPGAMVLKAGVRLDLGGSTLDNGWTSSGVAFQGIFVESPDIVSSGGAIAFKTNKNNWVNFSTVPQAAVTGQTLDFLAPPAWTDAKDVAPHLNTYSLVTEAAASGKCWPCIVHSTPVRMY